MTIKEAKTIDMVAYLSTMGYEPVKVSGNNYWYYSPLRSEKTPSFKINRSRNEWYDFGEGKGGNLLDFVLLLDNTNVSEALKRLAGSPARSVPLFLPLKDDPVIEVRSIQSVNSFSLIRYCKQRRIPTAIMDHWLKEISYKNGEKNYHALGFQNDAGGYELRARHFKGSSSPKASTLIKNNADRLAVFEGFFDFLSYLTIHQNQPAPLRDYLILNSTSFFGQQLRTMLTYRRVNLYLDNDATGNKYTTLVLEKWPEQFKDERSLFTGYKDLNEWHQHIGTAPKPAA